MTGRVALAERYRTGAGAIARAVGFLVAPEQTAAPGRSSLVPEAARVVVLGSADDAAPLAAALALALRAADRVPAALVAVWGGGGPGARRAATPGAARLAATLARRGLAAQARGRLVWLPLGADTQEAARDVRRAAAVVEGPLITALAGPRPPAFDDLLAEHDFAVVAAEPATALARAAVAALAGHRIPALACRPPRRGLPRTLALAGITAPRLDRALDVPLLDRGVEPRDHTLGAGDDMRSGTPTPAASDRSAG
jgi:hypothetical protein